MTPQKALDTKAQPGKAQPWAKRVMPPSSMGRQHGRLVFGTFPALVYVSLLSAGSDFYPFAIIKLQL